MNKKPTEAQWSEYRDWVANTFDLVGAKEEDRFYRSGSGQRSLDAHRAFLKERLRPGMRILELGSGAGIFTRELALSDPQTLIVVDISRTQIESNRQRAVVDGYEGAVSEWIHSDACVLDPSSFGEFDLLLCYGGILSYVFDQAQNLLRKCREFLKYKGMLIGSVMSLPGTIQSHFADFEKLDSKAFGRLCETGCLTRETFGPAGHFCQMYTAATLSRLLERGGAFAPVDLKGSNDENPYSEYFSSLEPDNRILQLIAPYRKNWESDGSASVGGSHFIFSAIAQ